MTRRRQKAPETPVFKTLLITLVVCLCAIGAAYVAFIHDWRFDRTEVDEDNAFRQ